MKKAFLLNAVLNVAIASFAQDTLTSKSLDEVLIYANKFAEKRKNIVQKIDVISSQTIAQGNAQNTGDLLINTGNVFVQKSQQGGSSPVIRGFEASRVLLVIDGIRMNNAIYRAGHLQNVITTDQNMIDRVEVLYGPASTIYGSDALGGVVHLRTKSPQLSTNEHLFVTGSAFIRYSSANNEKTGHSEVSMGGKKIAWLQSYNYSDFGDTKMGDKYPDKYPNFGRRSQYVARINGIDSVVDNPDHRKQKFSGYKQWDITQKLFFKQSEKVSHLLNLQYSNSTNVPRYDRLQDVRNGTLRYAEWYYGPQLRELAAYEFNVKNLGFLNEFKTIVSYQHIEESRHQREYRRYDKLDNRTEDLDVYAITIDGRKLWSNNELTVGMDAQLNDLKSVGVRKNINTGAETKLDSRYPNGDNEMNYFGVYAQHILKFKNRKLVLNDGIRAQITRLHSTIDDNSFFNFPFTEMEQNSTAFTGNLGLIFSPNERTRITGGVSTGFRAPNIDDLARIFESNTASRQVIIPNPNIKPEYTYNVDLNFTKEVLNKLNIEAGGFYTLFRNAIALAPFELGGEDSINYNGFMSAVYSNQNVNKAFIYGFNANVSFEVTAEMKLYSTVTYTYGRLQPKNATEVPLDHIPPVYGKTSLSYNHSRIFFECYALYNGWKKIKNHNPSGEDNAQYTTPDGTPSWITFNFKSTVKLHQKLALQIGIENILDRNYRYFASGFSAPGRNFILAMRSTF